MNNGIASMSTATALRPTPTASMAALPGWTKTLELYSHPCARRYRPRRPRGLRSLRRWRIGRDLGGPGARAALRAQSVVPRHPPGRHRVRRMRGDLRLHVPVDHLGRRAARRGLREGIHPALDPRVALLGLARVGLHDDLRRVWCVGRCDVVAISSATRVLAPYSPPPPAR